MGNYSAILVHQNDRWYSTTADILPSRTIFIQEVWISYIMADYTGDATQPLGKIINHWGWLSADTDDVSSALDEYITYGRLIFQKKNSSNSQLLFVGNNVIALIIANFNSKFVNPCVVDNVTLFLT
jgi:hypothetical protein